MPPQAFARLYGGDTAMTILTCRVLRALFHAPAGNVSPRGVAFYPRRLAISDSLLSCSLVAARISTSPCCMTSSLDG